MRRQRRRPALMTRSGITVLLAALLLQAPSTRAAPLDKEGCANLKAEQGQLENAGTRGNMAKGPQWAKTNLEPDKLDQVRRLLEVDEQLLFRCQGRPLVNLPNDPTDPDPAAREPGTDAAKSAPAAKVPKAPKKEVAKKDPGKQEPAKKKAAAQPANPAAKGQAKQGTPPPEASAAADKNPPAAKKKAKQKADDAYRPPGTEPGANPFANQAAPKQ
jgi:hypothetical protein